MEKGVLRNFTNENNCTRVSFNNFVVLRPATFLKKRPWYRYFPVKFAKFLRTLISQNTSGRLPLDAAYLKRADIQ